MDCISALASFQQANSFAFKNDELLLQALTHPSFVNEHPDEDWEDNQRLEFLGDAVIGFMSGEWLYHHFPDATEGRLTRLRSALVRTETLAQFGEQCGVGDVLRLGRGEAETGGRERATNLCAAFEAVVGALWLDLGEEHVRTLLHPLFEQAIANIVQHAAEKDAKSRFQEWAQSTLGKTPVYQEIHSSGPDHARVFTVAVHIGEEQYAEGVGRSKRNAEMEAAQKALARVEESEHQV